MDEYGAVFEAQAKSPSLRAIWREAYGADYPAEADPLSFVTQTDLDRIIAALELNPGDDLIDLACGAGGPGAHVARRTDTRLTGIDVSAGAIGVARTRHLTKLRIGSRFETGSFDNTGLSDQSADGLMSTDALFYSQDQGALFREIARIGKPRCRLAFTSFELAVRSRALDVGPVPEYRTALESAGFEVIAYEEASDWKSRMMAVFSGIIEQREELGQELGEPVARALIAWATLRPTELSDSCRVFVVAEKSIE